MTEVGRATVQRAPVRLAEVIAALSLATDLAMGQPMAFALRSCVLSVRMGEALGFDDAQLSEIYYQALLRYIGCNAETHAPRQTRWVRNRNVEALVGQRAKRRSAEYASSALSFVGRIQRS